MADILSHIVATDEPAKLVAGLHIEIIADLICPFCYLGKRRLEEALQAYEGPRDVSWYPYQLNPDMPADGMPLDDYLASRFGNPASIEPVLDGLAAAGRDTGIDFRFDKLARVPNTIAAHQLMQLAGTEGGDQSRLAEALMQAYFEFGKDIGDWDVLTEIALGQGMQADTVRNTFTDDRSRNAVRTREAQVKASGMNGVPGYLLNRRLLIVGAQPTDVMINAFDRATFGEGDDELLPTSVH